MLCVTDDSSRMYRKAKQLCNYTVCLPPMQCYTYRVLPQRSCVFASAAEDGGPIRHGPMHNNGVAVIAEAP